MGRKLTLNIAMLIALAVVFLFPPWRTIWSVGVPNDDQLFHVRTESFSGFHLWGFQPAPKPTTWGNELATLYGFPSVSRHVLLLEILVLLSIWAVGIRFIRRRSAV